MTVNLYKTIAISSLTRNVYLFVLRLAEYKISARSTFVQGSLVLNIWKLQTESCTLSGKLHMTDQQIDKFKQELSTLKCEISIKGNDSANWSQGTKRLRKCLIKKRRLLSTTLRERAKWQDFPYKKSKK